MTTALLGTMTTTHTGGPGNQDKLVGELLSFTGPSAYPTGGTTGFQALVQGALGNGAVEVVAVIAQDCSGYFVSYDKVHDKLKFYQGDNTNAAAAPGVQVPNATDLSGVTYNVLVLLK